MWDVMCRVYLLNPELGVYKSQAPDTMGIQNFVLRGLIFVGCQCGTCLISPIKHLNFDAASRFLENLFAPAIIASVITALLSPTVIIPLNF